ncbi:MAG: dethiobiotin synthase [Sulfuricellaceae bacterium]
MKGVFVAGTDTGVGKTLVAAALLRAFAASGRRAVGMKPVASGAVVGPGGAAMWEDVVMLQRAANVEAPLEWVNPYRFLPPVAPHLAAADAGAVIDLGCVAEAYGRLGDLADVVVVEGVGGFLVPLNDREGAAEMVCRLGLPVVLVVGMRLGCINHALLTAEAVRSRGLRLAGWVANAIDPVMARFDDNLAALRARLPAPLLGVIPPQDRPDPDPDAVATLLDLRAFFL